MKLYDDQLIVLTGGAGFIGSGVLRTLNDQGLQNIVIIDDLGKTEKWKNLVGKRFVDIIPIEKTFEWLAGKEALVEAFIHLGACTSTVETDADYLLSNNFKFSQRLVDYALKNEHRFIYASSAATYGAGEQGFSDDVEKLSSLTPLNMYGYSKHLFDLWLQSEGLLNRVVGLKYFNVFGPNEGHKGRMSSAIVHMLPMALKEGRVRLFASSEPDKYADGEQKRDFIYVKDVAAMTCAFLRNEATGIYNIGRGEAVSWNQLVTAMFKALDKPVQIDYIPMPEDLRGKYQNYSCADIKRTKKALGKEFKVSSIEESVKDYLQNYLLPGKMW